MRKLDRIDALPLLATLPALAIFAWWIADDGGYARAAWMPGVVVVAIVLGMAVTVAAVRPSRSALLAVAALAAYTLWSYASIVWADAPGPALEGSQRTLLYFVCFACFALLPWTPRALLVALGLLVLIITVLGGVLVARIALAADPSRFFLEARLVGPTGYPNASAALFTTGAMVALGFAARPEVIAWLRPLFLGASGLLLWLALATQSRGWLFTLPAVVLVTLLLMPGRARLILFGALVGGAMAMASGELLALYRLVGGLEQPALAPSLIAAFDEAVASLLPAMGALVAAGSLAVWIDARVRRRLTSSPRLRRAFAAAVLICAAGACAGAAIAATDGRPLDRADRAFAQLKSYNRTGSDSLRRFDDVSSNRYELWRVALDGWREHPVGGLGQDNFTQTYISERSNDYDESRWVHSLPLRLLAHTGLVGALLFALFVVAAVWAATVGGRRCGGGGPARAAGALALLPAVVWVAHGSVDWLWEYPALSAPALAFAGAASARSHGRAIADSPPLPERPSSGWRSRVRLALACSAAVACAAAVLPSYFADRDVRWAAANWAANPELAFDRLARARALNPLDAQASLVEGLIATQSGRLGRARASFERAAAREPHDWYARFELGLVAGARGDRREALEQLLAARRLNPRDPLVRRAVVVARRRGTISLEDAKEELDLRSSRLVYNAAP